MKVTLVVTKTCSHCPFLKQYFQKKGILCDVKYIEDNPQLRDKYNISKSPNIIVDGTAVFRKRWQVLTFDKI